MKERGGERKIITYWRDIGKVRISTGERELANIWGKIGSWQILLVKQEMDALR